MQLKNGMNINFNASDLFFTLFRLNTELYPDSWNPYDSYGESLLEVGDTINGIKAYAKSLELNPDNYNAIEVLKEFSN